MKFKKLISCLLVAAMAVSITACGGGTEDGSGTSQGGESSAQTSGTAQKDDGPLTPYEETITMDFGANFDVNSNVMTKLADAGEPYDNNRWTQLFEEKLNIKINYELIAPGDQYNQQIKLLMASNELPDYFAVYNWSDFQQMAEGGLLADMTDVYEQYASPLLRSIIETEGERIYRPVKYDGRMYGVPRAMPSTNGYNHLWIRQDWLDNLGLERPTTMDELLEVVRAFKEDDPDGNGQDDTYGMRLDNSYMSQKGLFWAFGGYPDFWITKEDGSIDYGTVQPEIKKGLNYIKTMLDEGLVNPEFITTDRETSNEEIVSGKSGMYYGAHWETPHLSVEANPDAKWVVIPLPTEDGKEIDIPLTPAVDAIHVAAANAEHPEALVKLLNVYVEALFGESGDFSRYFTVEGVGEVWNATPIFTLDPELDVDGHRGWKAAAEANDFSNIGGSAKGFYEFNEDGLIQYGMMFGPEDSAFAFVDQTYPDQIIWNAYFGAPTATQIERGGSMSEYLNTTLASLITGQVDMDEGFDQMVSEWRSMGGDQVISEITELVESYEE